MSTPFMRSTFLLIASLNLILLGCMVGPKYAPPNMEIPCEWHGQLSPGMQSESPDCFHWWEALKDPHLNSLMERAAAQNLDLFIAASRIREARLEKQGGMAKSYPRLDGSSTYGNVGYNKKTLNKLLDSNCCKKHTKSRTKHVNFFEVGFDVEWELDLFGMNAHELNALKAKLEASREEYLHIWISLSAEVARNYIELRTFQLRLINMNKNIHAQKETIQLSKSLHQAGFSGTVDEKQAEEQWNILAAQRPQITLAIDKAIHRLSILLGYAPGALFCELSVPSFLPVLPVQKPIGIPSELLRRRPDIKKAERDLAAATEMVGSAIAALFPRLSLTGFIGEITTFCSNGLAWFAGPQLLQPIFNSKLLQQDVKYNKIKVEQACYEYQKTVLAALEEVENAIASFHSELERNYYLAQARKASQEAYEFTHHLYQGGFKNYLDVLVTDRVLLEDDQAFLQSQADLLYHYISLYKALGGGWCLVEDCP